MSINNNSGGRDLYFRENIIQKNEHNLNESTNFNNLELSDKITYLFNSQEFVDIFDDKTKLINSIWLLVEFFIIFDSLDFEKYLNYARFMNQANFESNLKYNQIYTILQEQFWNKELDNEVIFDYIFQKHSVDWYYYHCFNWASEESIKMYWLSTHIRNFSNEEFEEIIQILSRSNIKELHFELRKKWFPCYFTNSEWKLSFSLTADQISHYILEVPEWFAIFITRCTENSLIRKAFNSKQPYSIVQKDINESIWKIISDTNDKIVLLKFIEKYWNMYTEKNNLIALVKRKSIDWYISDEDVNLYKRNILDFATYPEELIELLLDPNKAYFDTQISIKPEDILIVNPWKL